MRSGLDYNNFYISENVHLIMGRHLEADAGGSGNGSTKKGIAPVYADRALRQGRRTGDLASRLGFLVYRGLPPIKEGEDAIYECAQGVMIDVDYGHYPYVTSSNVFPGCQHKIDKTVGVFKARPRKCYWNDIRELDYAMGVAQPDEVVMTKVDILKDREFAVITRDGKELIFTNVNDYIIFMKEQYPKLKYVSNSPQGELEKI
jgi:adenylosuccinate synthase